MQSHGIGKALLNYAKNKRSKLFLNVYQKNIRAIAFYQREGFEIQCSDFDKATEEKEYVMAWLKIESGIEVGNCYVQRHLD